MSFPGKAERLSVQDQAQMMEILLENVREYAIILVDPEGHVLTWNAAAERLKGWKADEIIGQHFSRFYPEEELQAGRPAKELETAAQLGRYEEEVWRVRKDGTRFRANVLMTALRDENGKLRGFGKVTRDLTERNRA